MTLLAVLVVLGVGLAGCGDSGGDSSSSAKVDRRAASDGAQRQTVDAGRRSVIRTANLDVEVMDNPDLAAGDARKLAVEVGGFLAAANTDGEGVDRVAQVTLRVPEDRFDLVVARVTSLDTVTKRSVGSDDVTDKLVDLEGRLKNAQTSAQRLRELLAEAGNVDTVLVLERELTKRETDVETLSGQIKALDDQVSLSTVEASFSKKQVDKDPGINRDLPGPLRALWAGFVALINVLQVVLVVVAFVLPFAAVAGLLLVVYRAWRRRHPKAVPPAAPAGPAGVLWGNPPPPGAWTPTSTPGTWPTASAPGQPTASPEEPSDTPGDTDPTAPGG